MVVVGICFLSHAPPLLELHRWPSVTVQSLVKGGSACLAGSLLLYFIVSVRVSVECAVRLG